MTQDFFQTACERGIKIFLSKIISLISKKKKKKKKKMIVHDKKNHLKLEEKERESTFFQLKEWQPMAITTWLKHQYCL